jgi:nicotinate phosphoribosyltransferase
VQPLAQLYKHSLALLTDLYQITMAYGYWKSGLVDRKAVFHSLFRSNPFAGGYAICCGLEYFLDYLEQFHFDESDLSYLAAQKGNDGKRLFDPAFMDYLRDLKFTVDIDAIPEGTAVFPGEPLVRITGPLIQCQLIETPLLNIMNFQTLIATKAARICLAAQGEPVIDFGLRRAQGIDGALTAARAAYVGGCTGTSNVLAGKLFDIPVKGTHAHSWVMTFETELEAFETYAQALPNNCVFLVDTYDTLEGVRHAIEVGKHLRQRGHEMIGIRLDSGDLAYLSIEARKLLDAAGFEKAGILASNDLDENVITSLKQQGATIAVWGVGTRLVTGGEQAALGGVYKLSAVQNERGEWQNRIKLSEQTAKVSVPGVQQVRRFSDGNGFIGDAIYDTHAKIPESPTIVDPGDPIRQKTFSPQAKWEDLLVPVARNGKVIYNIPPLAKVRERTLDQLNHLHAGMKRLINPHRYPVGLERGLFDVRAAMIEKLKSRSGSAGQRPAKPDLQEPR